MSKLNKFIDKKITESILDNDNSILDSYLEGLGYDVSEINSIASKNYKKVLKRLQDKGFLTLKKDMTIKDHLLNVEKLTAQSKVITAINMLKNASCEKDVLDAVFVKEQAIWLYVDEELKDQWYEYYGDAQVYLP